MANAKIDSKNTLETNSVVLSTVYLYLYLYLYAYLSYLSTHTGTCTYHLLRHTLLRPFYPGISSHRTVSSWTSSTDALWFFGTGPRKRRRYQDWRESPSRMESAWMLS